MDEDTWFGFVHVLSAMRLAYPQQWVTAEVDSSTGQAWDKILNLYDFWLKQDSPPDFERVQALAIDWLKENAPYRVKPLIV
jgi:hypothetical protein